MSLEGWAALAQVATFVVIAATAAASLVQLRHLRAANQVAADPEITICNFFDKWGSHYREGAIDKRAFMRMMAGVTVGFWKRLEPAIALMANSNGVNTAFEHFEYVTVEARR
jgi:hypothetical protein